jgi:hypothetical protein
MPSLRLAHPLYRKAGNSLSHCPLLGATSNMIRDLLHHPCGVEKETSIMENTHVHALAVKHAGLENRIEAENRRPHPDTILIADLKKQKLRLKEEIIQLQ